jgi:hypothetical protein
MSALRNSGDNALDVGLEATTIDPAVEHERRDHASSSQPSD